MALVSHFEFIKIPVIIYMTIGLEALEPPANRRLRSNLLRIFYLAGLVNLYVQWLLEFTELVFAIRSSSIVAATAVAPCAGFGFVGSLKLRTLVLNKLPIRELLQQLENMHPNSMQLQKDYKVERCVKTLRPVMGIFAFLCIVNTFYFGFLPLGQITVGILLHGAEFDYPLGFPMWYPFDPAASWSVYVLCYFLQMWSAYLVGVAVSTADLLLVSTIGQICMHFDYISMSLRQYEPKSIKENHQFLSGILKQHIKCLELSSSVDKVFSFALLLNFLLSSGTICFIGFLFIAASNNESMRYILLLVTSLLQVMIICIYGNKLIESSQAVGEAAFGHPWYECDLIYKRMVLLLIFRSQKIAAIHAPTFPPICLETFMKVISMSYQIFALLQTTNENQQPDVAN